MATYGMKILDSGGTACVLTPEVGTIISAGRITMPSGLVDTNKYYATIDLPSTIPVANLGVLMTPVKWTPRLTHKPYATDGGAPWNCYQRGRFLNDDYSYYSKNIATGVMTSYTAGACTASAFPGTPASWNHAVSAYPLSYWELLGASSVSSVKIFAATCYCVAITAQTSGWDYEGPIEYPIDDFRYSIYTDGVETVDYMIICKKYNY